MFGNLLKTSQAAAALRDVVKINNEQNAWLDSLIERGRAVEQRIDSALDTFKRDPSDQTLKLLLEANRFKPDARLLADAEHQCSKTVRDQQRARSTEPFIAALEELVKAFRAELAKISASDLAKSKELDVPLEDVRSEKLICRFEQNVASAENYINRLKLGEFDVAKYGQLSEWILS